MKLTLKLIAIIFTLAYFQIGTLSAQAPQKFNYQGIARDVKGNPLAKQKMSLKISVLPTQDATVSEYEETQMVTTNEFGLYTLQIGAGTPISGDMKTVKWETGNKYIKIAIDQKGGTDYVDAGTTQLLSVPYAIYADKAGLARETVEGTDKTRTGAVSSNAAHVAGDANYVTKFTGLNTIGKSLIYDNGSRVGIGTTTPLSSGLLHLQSVIGTQPLILESPQGVHNLIREAGVNRGYFGSYIGSGGAYPTPAGTSDADFDIGTSGASTGKLHLATNTTPRLSIMPTTGNVGIGTTTPTTKLEVAGQVKITGGTPGAGKVLTSDATGLATWQTPTSGSGNAWSLNGNAATDTSNFIGTTDNAPLRFKINSVSYGFFSAGSNLAIGRNSQDSTTGGNNVSIGNRTLEVNKSGNYNTAIGSNSMQKNIVGIENTAIGDYSLYNNTIGSQNTAMGNECLEFNTEGSNNTGIGNWSLLNNTIGNENTAIGNKSLRSNIIGSYNVSIGTNALYNNTEISNLVAIGDRALYKNGIGASGSQGEYNTAIGAKSLYENTIGRNNTAVGPYTLYTNSTGNSNVAFGSDALFQNQSGNDNVAIGTSALLYNTTADKNVAIGKYALASNVSGSNNTALGYQAGNVLNSTSVFNTICLGYSTGWNTTTSNQVNIGNHSIVSIGGEVNWGTYSDKRIKNNIQENVPGLAFISKLKPVTYNLDIHKQYELSMRGQKDTTGDFPGKYDIEKIKMTGFLAQDVEQAAKDCSYDFSGVEAPQNGDGLYKIRYAEFVVPLVKSVQELQTLLEVEKQKNLTLEARLKAIEEKLK